MSAEASVDSVTKPSDECSSKPWLKRKSLNNLSTGQFSGTFTNTGGKLDSWMSDDYLEIPEGAIPDGEEWTIHANIHTSLDDFTHLLKKTKGECFVAAINDYQVDGDYTFNKPVKVVVHHSVHKTSELANLCIQLRSDKHESIDVPYHTQKTADGPWYEVDGPRILVYTYHFTQVICKICNSEECKVKAIKGLVYSKITTDSQNKFYAIIEVFVHFIRNVEKLPVFSEVFSQERNGAKYQLIQAKTFPPSLRLIAPTDKVGVSISFTGKEWNFLEDSDIHKKVIVVEDIFPCLMEAYDPVCVGTYMLQGSVPNLNGNITLSIGGSHVVKLPVATEPDVAEMSDFKQYKETLDFVASNSVPSERFLQLETNVISLLHCQADTHQQVNERQFAGSSVEWILKDARLYEIAKKIKYESWFEVGIKLGLTAIELEQMEANNSNEYDVRRIFNMLRVWRDGQEKIGEQELEIFCRSLSETANTEALKLLA